MSGRKTDIKDSEWLADLLPPSFITPIRPAPNRALRYRKSLVQSRTQEINRLHKVLESASITLAAVATDILGKSSRSMLKTIAAVASSSPALAKFALRLLRKKLPQLCEALQGQVKPHHRLLLTAFSDMSR